MRAPADNSSVCTGQRSELKKKGLAAVQTDEDTDSVSFPIMFGNYSTCRAMYWRNKIMNHWLHAVPFNARFSFILIRHFIYRISQKIFFP